MRWPQQWVFSPALLPMRAFGATTTTMAILTCLSPSPAEPEIYWARIIKICSSIITGLTRTVTTHLQTWQRESLSNSAMVFLCTTVRLGLITNNDGFLDLVVKDGIGDTPDFQKLGKVHLFKNLGVLGA